MSTDVIKGSKISILILYRRRRFINHLLTYLLTYYCNSNDNVRVFDHGELEQSVHGRLHQQRKTGNTIWPPKPEILISHEL